jgi:2-oxoglutarate ferredoxin oxidoreductase subunit alpha
VAPYDALDAFNTMAEVFNLTDKLQIPAMVLSDLLISEGTFSVDPAKINMQPTIDRGKLIREGSANGGEYKRYLHTDDGVAPRAIPGVEGHMHVVSTDEHDEDGILISDEFTNPHKRRKNVERRDRKMGGLEKEVAAPELEGPADADVTLIGFGSTIGVIREACDQLRDQGVSVNHFQVKWIVPFHAEAISNVIKNAKRTIIVENNHSGQFYRYMRSETGLDVDGHIRKYDGEPFMPHHIVGCVQEQLAGETTHSVPYQEIMV